MAYNSCMHCALCSAERGNIGRLWKLLPRDKEFDRHMKYLNTYCETLIQERRAEPVELLEARKDLLSKILLARHVRECGLS